MPVVEQLVFGLDIKNADQGRVVLAHSPGMGQATGSEIVELCEGWGTAPALGMLRPAVMSFPLNSSMPAMRGRLFVIIHLTVNAPQLFHAVVLTESDYVAFGRNPFCVVNTGVFIDSWTDGTILDRKQISVENLPGLVSPPPSANDLGIVDEALKQVLGKGTLQLPVEQAVRESDRCLALLIAAMPAELKRDLRFASFSINKTNKYNLSAVLTTGSTFAGWTRLFMTSIGGELDSDCNHYLKSVQGFLKAGDLAGMQRFSQYSTVRQTSTRENLPRQTRNVVSATVAPETNSGTFEGQLIHAQKQAADRKVTSTANAGTRGPKVRAVKSQLRRVRANSAISRSRSTNKSGRVFILLTVLAVCVWGSSWWMKQQSVDGKLHFPWESGWLAGSQNGQSEDRIAALLVPVDVGRIYDKQIKRVSKAGLDFLPRRSRDRQDALAVLLADAAGPLLIQLNTFCTFVGEGIQPGSRPEREIERLSILSKRGQLLETETARLELAWHALSSETDWQDLSRLSGKKVLVRRDSLLAGNPKTMTKIRSNLGIDRVKKTFAAALAQAEGMVALSKLFQQNSRSDKWESALYSAAEKVSPSASVMTRAYRNSAFSMVRLKQAEKVAVDKNLAYSKSFGGDHWLSPEVKDVLPILRRQIGKFSHEGIPELLVATLAWYALLEDPTPLLKSQDDAVAYLALLENNVAHKFDPIRYRDIVGRARYEAVTRQLAAGLELSDISEELLSPDSREDFASFLVAQNNATKAEHWEQLGQQIADPFLNRWVQVKAETLAQQREQKLNNFDTAYASWRTIFDNLQNQVSEQSDWTALWVDLNNHSQEILDTYARDLGGSPIRAIKLAEVGRLKRRINGSLQLTLLSVTARLEQNVLTADQDVAMEIEVGTGGQLWRSEAFRMGPAAPAGTGWVGTFELNHSLEIKPDQEIRVRVLSADDQTELALIEYPALTERVGPGALVRPRQGAAGKLSFRIDDSIWGSLSMFD